MREALLIAENWNKRILSEKINKDGFRFESPSKWIIVFVGKIKYDCENIKKKINLSDSNINLIIVGINLEDLN